MTNKEWLMNLNSYDCALFCLDWLPIIGRDSMSSVYGVSEWLNLEHKPEYHIIKQFNEVIRLNALTHQQDKEHK